MKNTTKSAIAVKVMEGVQALDGTEVDGYKLTVKKLHPEVYYIEAKSADETVIFNVWFARTSRPMWWF